jgi:F420-non-reducing hydrogenase small subunit
VAKPKVAFYWNASCGGCEEAVVDLAEDILKVADAVEIVLWPVAMDFKRSDVEALKDGEIAVAFLNGGVRTSEQEDWAKLLRRKSGLVVAFGSCAHLGGVPGLANFYDREGVFRTAYHDVPSMESGSSAEPQRKTKMPEGELELPEVYDRVYALDQVIDVDYYLPGCAPPPDLIMDAVGAILKGELPPKGSVLARGGRGVHGPGDSVGVRRAVHQRQHALPRVLRTDEGGQGPGCEVPVHPGLDHRHQR